MRRIALALAVLVAVIGAATLLNRRADRSERAERREARLLQFDDRLVTAIELVERTQRSRFERKPQGWRMTAPVSDAASAVSIEQVMIALRRSPVVERVEPSEALADYGLDPPRVVLRLEGVDAPPLSIGDVDPTGAGLFAAVDGRPGVLVLHLPEAGALEKLTATRLRDESATGVRRTELELLGMRRGGSRAVVRREADGWWIVDPRRLPASETAVDRVLTALDKLTVVAVEDGVDRSASALGLGSDALALTLGTAETSRTLVLGAATQEGYRFGARDDRDTLLVVDAASLDGVPLELDALLDRRLTKINRYAVKRLVWSSGGRRIAAVRGDDASWSTDAGPALAEARVLSFLVATVEARTSGWRAGVPRGRKVASLDVELDAGARETVEFFEGGEARVGSIEGVVFALEGRIPDFDAAER